MIRVSNEVRDLIEDVKIIPREPLNDCLKRIIGENQKYHNEHWDSQTKNKMEKELNEFVLNPKIPDPKEEQRKIWLEHHPGETIGADELIHHINGNHGDNRPENLMKVNSKGHGEKHSEITALRKKELQMGEIKGGGLR